MKHNGKKKLTLAIILALVCTGVLLAVVMQKGSSEQPLDTIPQVKPSEIVILNDGDTYNLTAAYVNANINGRSFKMLGYNGMIPGPLIKIQQGAEVNIQFKNDLDMETALHSHGVRMENQFDGAAPLTQTPIKPGSTFRYTLRFPDAGMYWYHPHVREDYQQELGLYGNYLVAPADPQYWNPVDKEIFLFLDDILVEEGQITLNRKEADHTLMGRYGNVFLINGATTYAGNARQGEVIRMYITNAANARPFNFSIDRTRMKLVGADSGAYEKESWADHIVIAPSERAIVEVLFDEAGTYALRARTPGRTYALGQILVASASAQRQSAADFSVLRSYNATISSIDAFRPYFEKQPDKMLILGMDMMGSMRRMPGMGHQGHMMPDGTMMGGSMMSLSPDGIEWDDTNSAMNRMSDTQNIHWMITDPSTADTNMDIMWRFNTGDKIKIRIFNDPSSMHPMQHPIHFHGQRFLVLATDGVSNTNLVWKDTVLIPAGRTVDILLDASNPGTWMAHCHIAEHLEADMMFSFTVE